MSEKASLIKKGICEAIGIFCLTFIACGMGTAFSSAPVGIVPVCFGGVIIAMAYSIGHVSGCHINPAVSLNFLIRKKISAVEFGVYIVSQLIGALLGSFLLAVCLRWDFHSLCSNTIQPKLKHVNKHGNLENDAYSYLIAILVEFILTFLFILVINGVTDDRYKDSQYAGFVIGAFLMIGVGNGLTFTNGCLNPWRALAPAIFESVKSTTAIKEIWVFLVGPFLGAVACAFAYDPLFG